MVPKTVLRVVLLISLLVLEAATQATDYSQYVNVL